MSEESATDAGMDSAFDFSIIQHDDPVSEHELLLLQNTSTPSSTATATATATTTTGDGGKGRLQSIRENLSKQQERLSALRERAMRKQEDGRRKSSMSDSMESLKTLGNKLTALKARGNGAAPAVAQTTQPPPPPPSAPSTGDQQLVISGSEKLQILTQRTEQNRALIEQRKRDIAKSLFSIKSNMSSNSTELGSSMTDLRTTEIHLMPPVSRHRSVADLQPTIATTTTTSTTEPLDEGRLKLLQSKLKLSELKQSRKEQELQQELLQSGQLVQQLKDANVELQQTVTRQTEELQRLRSTCERSNELEQINDMLETTRGELQEQLTNAQDELEASRLSQRSSDTDGTLAQVNAELAKQLQDLQQQLEQMRTENTQLRNENASKLSMDDAEFSARLAELQATIDAQRLELAVKAEELAEKTTEVNVLNVNLHLLEEKLTSSTKSKQILLPPAVSSSGEDKLTELQSELEQLKQKLDESNKTNIKLKLKCKQAEKQLTRLNQSSEMRKEMARLSAENGQLLERLTVLEDEKGQWQLAHVHEEDAAATATIRLLEEQKEELQQALLTLQQGSGSSNSNSGNDDDDDDTAARVESELSEVQLEEQLTQRVHELELEAAEQRDKLQSLHDEKEALNKKLTHYINENMELLDKVEKLSKSSSSAESIEIVERPIIEQLIVESAAAAAAAAAAPSVVSELTQTDLPEADELLPSSSTAIATSSFSRERDELLQKIELFTTERREVLSKMEQLSAENADLQSKLEQYSNEVQQLERSKCKLEQQLMTTSTTSSTASSTMAAAVQPMQELTSMQKSSEVVAALDHSDGTAAALFDKCEKSLQKLNSELEAYRKANDRNAKFNVSKKLAKEAKNVHLQLTELLQKVKEASHAVETVTVVETVVAVTAPNGKALAEYEQLTAQNVELKSTVAALQQELLLLQDAEQPQPQPQQLAIENVPEEIPNRDEDGDGDSIELERLREQLTDASSLISEQREMLTKQQMQLDQIDEQMNAKEMSNEQEVARIMQHCRELEQRNETLDGEQRILQTLIAEQKQQLIEVYSESEHNNNLKVLELQQAHENLAALTAQLATRESSKDYEKLCENLKINKSLVAQQMNDLANRQETIDSLNQQLNELYASMEERLQAQYRLEDEMKLEREAHESSEVRNKELREKLKKFAVTLKKRVTENAELEQQLQELRKQQQQQQQQQQDKQRERERAEEEDEEKKKSEQVELQQVVAKLNDELKQKLHMNLENRGIIKELKQTTEKQLQELQEKQKTVEMQQSDLEYLKGQLAVLEDEKMQLGDEFEEERKSLQAQLEQSQKQLSLKTAKFEKSKEVIKQRNATIQQLQRQLAELRAQPEEEEQEQEKEKEEERKQELQTDFQELQFKYQALQQQYASEKITFEETIARLETLHDGIQAKLQQDMAYIESLEANNAAAEQRESALSEQLEESNEKLRLAEDALQAVGGSAQDRDLEFHERLAEHEERWKQQAAQLAELMRTAEEANERAWAMQNAHDAALNRIKVLQQEAATREQQLSEQQALHEELKRMQDEVETLQQEILARSTEIQRQRAHYDAKLAVKVTEMDDLECELSAHMERAAAESRDLTQQVERIQERFVQKTEEISRLTDDLAQVERERATLSREVNMLRLQQDSAEQDALELQELRMQALQDKTEMDHLRGQIETLCANHGQELQALTQQLAELDTLGQNQTDDQVYVLTENKRLAEQLTELQAEIALLRERDREREREREREPTVAPAGAAAAAASIFFSNDISPFDEIIIQPQRVSNQLGAAPPPPPPPPPDAMHHPVAIVEQPTIEDLQRNVSDLEKHAQDLETKLMARNQTLGEQQQQRHLIDVQVEELRQLLHQRDEELLNLRAQLEERERLAAIDKQIQCPTQPTTLHMFFPEQQQQQQHQEHGNNNNNNNIIDVNMEAVKQAEMMAITQTTPIVEEVIVPKKAYLCQPLKTAATNDWGEGVDIIDDDDDPWATAAVEEMRQSSDQQQQQQQQQQNEERIGQLEGQLAASEQQRAELQTKTVKLMKLVKEYKTKAAATATATATTTAANVDNDLDSAIIDELKHQLELSETKVARTEEQLQQHLLEREKLNKRIDVLSAGNERWAELKERQDMDVQMYQARIRELQEKLNHLESWGDDEAPSNTNITIASDSNVPAAAGGGGNAAGNIDANIDELQAEIEELQQQLLVEKQNAEKAHVEATKLKQQLDEEKAQFEAIKLKQQQQLDESSVISVPPVEFRAAPAPAPANDELVAVVQEKESEIVHLRQRIEELMREDQTERLVLEILTKNQELQLLRMQVKQLEEDKREMEVVQLAAIEVVAPPPSVTPHHSEIEQQLRLENGLLEQEKADMEEELRVLNNHVLSSLAMEEKMQQIVLELDAKNIEISELRKTVENLQQAAAAAAATAAAATTTTTTTTNTMDYNHLNEQWEAVVEQKCSEVAKVWQEHLAQREAAFNEQLQQLQQQQQQQQQQLTREATPDELQLKMEKALETQEMEIVTLKEQLAIRSAEYARLAAQFDPFRLHNSSGGTQIASGGNSSSSSGGSGSGGLGGTATDTPTLTDYVLKADLDYALMMVHQRDMRVEEMIHELVQLLEERDHLQLKLSDALRQLEAERSQAAATPTATTIGIGIGIGSGSSSSSSNNPELSTATTTSTTMDLKQKLAELQTVKHSKDKAIVDEREQRLQQMIQLQRDMMSKVTTTTPPPPSTPPPPPQLQPQPPLSSTSAAVPPPPPQTTTTTADFFGGDLTQPQAAASAALRSPAVHLMDWILGNSKGSENQNESQAHN